MSIVDVAGQAEAEPFEDVGGDLFANRLDLDLCRPFVAATLEESYSRRRVGGASDRDCVPNLLLNLVDVVLFGDRDLQHE